MTTAKFVSVALSADTLLAKSKVYIGRAIAAKGRGDLGEFQLWASLALELLGKAALSKVHPCLVADPNSAASLFAAAGMNIDPDVKTIAAKTLFDRLTHLSKRFDQKTKDFCTNMSLKRNAELHSGEVPFEGVVPGSWEGRFWHTAEIILQAMDSTVESWLGANQAKAPKALIAEYNLAVGQAAMVKVETAAEAFKNQSKQYRHEAQERAEALRAWDARRNFSFMTDGIWSEKCPACGSKAFVAGAKYHEEVSEEDNGDFEEEAVDVYYVAEEFHCPACQLHLDSREAIDAVGLAVDYQEQETRQRDYGEEYGNE